MTGVHLVREKFTAAERLAQILTSRMVPLCSDDAAADATSGRASALVCSAEYAASIGGQDAVLAKGRAMRATQLLVVSEDQERFSITDEFGGKVLRIALPKLSGSPDVCDDYGLQLISTFIAGEGNVAAGDKLTFDLLALGRRVAKTDVTVFVNGPTGTGKEVLAKFIHAGSPRADAPFVGINCAAIPENMLEAILFGHEKGAFTGASTANKGIFRAADGGTLLLDEISEMPMSLQAKLLRALQEKAVTPIGSQTDIPVDVRVIATTNRNMAAEIQKGAFREDLYYRLNVFPLMTSAVAARPADIVPIAAFLLRRHSATPSVVPWLDASAIAVLRSYGWPGNVRELENVLQRALVLSTDGIITAAEIVTDDALHHMTDMPVGGLQGIAPAMRQQAVNS